MLGKVLKYDLKSIGKIIVPAFIFLLGLSILTRIGYILGDSLFIFQVLSSLIGLFAIIGLVALPFLTLIICVRRFYCNLFKEEGYLTNTLPVKRITLLNSKIISMISYFIMSIVVIVCSLLLIYYDVELVESIVELLKLFKEISIPLIIILLLSFTSYYMLITTAYSIGQTKNGNKITNSIISGAVLYFITQLMSLTGLAIIWLTDKDIYNKIELNDTKVIGNVLWLAIAIILIIQILEYVIMRHALNKKMDIE